MRRYEKAVIWSAIWALAFRLVCAGLVVTSIVLEHRGHEHGAIRALLLAILFQLWAQWEQSTAVARVMHGGEHG